MPELHNVLLIGSGGREHALAEAIAKSAKVGRLLVAPGNPGIAAFAETIDVAATDHDALLRLCRDRNISLVVIGPEAPLGAGLADDLTRAGFAVFGPHKAAAALETSKGFAKDFCREFDIPTAAYGRFTSAAAAKAYVRAQGAPIVVKADGLAAGKGVVVAESVDEAEAAIDRMFGGALGAAGLEIVVEEMLRGEEVSFFALADGRRALPFGSAHDHKRAFDGDLGPNTGGMGAYSPSPLMDEAMVARVMSEIVTPVVDGMAARRIPFKGVLFVGLMLTASGPKVIEFNVRFGDPETQVLLPRLDEDLVPFLEAVAAGALPSKAPRFSPEASLCVVMAADGYPEAPLGGTEIRGLDKAAALEGVRIYHAGTKRDGAKLVANGGRVINVVALAPTLEAARARAYEGVAAIDWPQGFCRSDIGAKARPAS